MLERAKTIQKLMMRAGYSSAAENFVERAFNYSRREFESIERWWLSNALKYR